METMLEIPKRDIEAGVYCAQVHGPLELVLVVERPMTFYVYRFGSSKTYILDEVKFYQKVDLEPYRIKVKSDGNYL